MKIAGGSCVLARRSVLVLVLVLVLGVVVLGVVLTGCSAAPRSLGALSWSDASTRSSSSSELTVSADVDRAWASAGCANFSERVAVHETSQSVTIEVVGYAAALPPGTSCSAGRVSAARVEVHLRAPIGSRSLIDATTSDVHPLLNLAAAPALHAVPAHFSEQVGYWTESTGVAYRWWRRFRPATQINLYSGPRAALESYLQKLPSGARRVDVRGRSARVVRTASGDGWDTRVDWRVSGVRGIELEVLDQSRTPMTAADVVALARATY